MPWLSCIISNVVLASFLALAAWFVQRRLRSPMIARILWVLALVKLVTPPMLSVPLGETPGTIACALGTCGCEQHARIPAIVRDTFPWVLLTLWSAGAGTTGWNAWRRWTRFRRLMAYASPVPPEWQSLAARLTSELSIRRLPEILAVPGRLPPLVVPGWRRPRVLLPLALLDRLNGSQKATLLLHELVHIKRGDHLVRILELAVSVAFWWLPIVRPIGRQLRACEETCCDAAVAAHLPHARRDYAQLLLDVFDFANPLPRHGVPQVTAMSVANDLEHRLLAILNAPHGTRRAWPAGALAVGLACAILPCELHYNLFRRPAPAAILETCDPAAAANRLPIDMRCEPPATFACPS